MRNKSIDLIKGVLIILVIIGHVVPGGLKESLIRWVIYGVHMPLFLAVSGYMFNIDKYRGKNIIETGGRYFKRIVAPWLLAVIIYAFLNALFGGGQVSLLCDFLYGCMEPYYHLWFVIAYIVYIFVTLIYAKIMTKLRVSDSSQMKILLVCAVIISVAWKFVPTFLLSLNVKYMSIIRLYVRPWLFVFFVMGIILRKYEIVCPKVRNVVGGIGVCGIITLVITYFTQSTIIINVNFFILNISITLICVYVIKNDYLNVDNSLGKFVKFVGRHSYSFYLWHMIGIMLLKDYCGTKVGITYWTGIIVWICILSILIWGYERYICKMISGIRIFSK